MSEVRKKLEIRLRRQETKLVERLSYLAIVAGAVFILSIAAWRLL